MSSPTFDREIEAAGVVGGSLGAAALCEVLGIDLGPCPYEGHRGADWLLPAGGPVMCGICHPPAEALEVIAA